MPDRPIYQTGENEYMTGWDDPNFTRSLFGLRRDPYALQSQEEVTVSAPFPDTDKLYPRDINQIYLGTQTAPPTGTWTPPNREKTRVDPRLQGAWNEVIQRHPYAQNFINEVRVKDDFPGDVGATQPWGTKQIFAIPEATGDLLAHEVTHAAQAHQRPGSSASEGGRGILQEYMGRGGITTPYREREGEKLAYASGQAYRMDTEREDNMRRANQDYQRNLDYLAGKGPLPSGYRNRREVEQAVRSQENWWQNNPRYPK